MKLNNNLKSALIAIVASLATIFLVKAFTGVNGTDVIFNTSDGKSQDSMVTLANLPAGNPGDFTYAAEVSAPSVVHIKALTTRTQSNSRRPSSIFEQFFGFDEEMFGGPQQRQQNQESSGSGVIISNDGYIVTNNHVIEGTSSLEVVTFNKKSYTAKIIGRDPSTDIAVIKIEETNLPAMTFGNSDEVRIGEWVLAVGNPFNLESTVTAGIISAIGRNINILGRPQNQRWSRNQEPQEKINPIESFIQTDAAVNPGNSGGALVNLNGHLIGINTAIASPNGAYAGYAFAVPSGIVKKVATDIIKFGDVQRGYAGIEFRELDNKTAAELGIKAEDGIYVNNVTEGGAAQVSGIKKGDVIIKADGISTNSGAKFSELIGRKRPGEKVQFVVDRNGSLKNITITLKDSPDGKIPAKKDPALATAYGKMGLELTNLSDKELKSLGINSGVKVSNLRTDGLVATKTNIDKGFIITTLGNKQVNSAKEVQDIINAAYDKGEEGILICGFYPNGPRGCDGIPIR